MAEGRPINIMLPPQSALQFVLGHQLMYPVRALEAFNHTGGSLAAGANADAFAATAGRSIQLLGFLITADVATNLAVRFGTTSKFNIRFSGAGSLYVPIPQPGLDVGAGVALNIQNQGAAAVVWNASWFYCSDPA